MTEVWTPEVIKLVAGGVTVILLGLVGAITHYDRRRRREGGSISHETRVDLSPVITQLSDHERAAQERHKALSAKIDNQESRLHSRLDSWRDRHD